MKHVTLLSVLVTLIACDAPPDSDSDAGGADAGSADAGAAMDAGGDDAGPGDDAGADDAGPVDAGRVLAFGCSESDLAACRYAPAEAFGVGTQNLQTLTYPDESGVDRSIQIDVRLPAAAAQPAPLIIWSHGGAGGQAGATNAGIEWSRVFVEAGYAVVAIAHAPRDAASYAQLCRDVGFPAAECDQACATAGECMHDGAEGICVDGGCRYWKHLSWDRPHDFAFVVEELVRRTEPGRALDGAIDLDRLIYAGHSAGAGSTMMAAGATRMIAGTDRLFVHERPIAFLSFSPQPSDDDGFTPEGYSGAPCLALGGTAETCLTRPHMVLTGVGDGDEDEGPRRREAHDLPPAGRRWLTHIEELAARHTTFQHGVDACERYARDESLDPAIYPERCASYLRWLESAALAFLDAHARERPEAIEYLASQNLEVLGEGALTFERR